MDMWLYTCREVCMYVWAYMYILLNISMCEHEYILTICMLYTWLLMRMISIIIIYITKYVSIIKMLENFISYLFIYLFLHIMLCIGTCQVVVGFTKPVGGYESIQVPDRYTIVQYHDIFIFIYTHTLPVCWSTNVHFYLF